MGWGCLFLVHIVNALELWKKGSDDCQGCGLWWGVGGRVKLDLKGYLVVDTSILVDRGEGVTKEVVVLVGAFTSWHIRYKFLTWLLKLDF